MRRDLKMRRGKEIAQGGHASMAWLRPHLQEGKCLYYDDLMPKVKVWLETGMTKICVRVNSKEELLVVWDKAIANGVLVRSVYDMGKTEFDGKETLTCLAIGPDYPEKLEPVTGDLELY